MKYRPPVEFKRRRAYCSMSVRSLNLPRLVVIASGYPGEADETCIVSFSFGTDGSDPAFLLDFELAGTRLGRWVSETYWAWLKWRGR